jgi:hypothetical protein
MSYLRGKHYAVTKKKEGRPTQLDQNDQVSNGETAGVLAKQHKVSSATIRRDASFAKSVELRKHDRIANLKQNTPKGNFYPSGDATAEQMSYLRGKAFELKKLTSRGGGDRKSEEAQNQKGNSYPFDIEDTTSGQLAKQHKVSEKTIKNDAAFAREVPHLWGIPTLRKNGAVSGETAPFFALTLPHVEPKPLSPARGDHAGPGRLALRVAGVQGRLLGAGRTLEAPRGLEVPSAPS